MRNRLVVPSAMLETQELDCKLWLSRRRGTIFCFGHGLSRWLELVVSTLLGRLGSTSSHPKRSAAEQYYCALS